MRPAWRIVCLVFGLLGAVFLLAAAAIYCFVPAQLVRSILCMVFGLLGACYLAVALLLCALSGRGERRRQALLGYGRYVQATVVEVQEDRRFTVNRHHPFTVLARCSLPQSGTEKTLRSHLLWHSVSLAPGDSVSIFFDPMNDGRFAFDIRVED